MKEVRFFYVPDAPSREEMPEEEAMHALRVLRLKSGDTMMITDGCGNFFEAEITLAATRRCLYKIIRTLPQTKPWHGKIHLVVSPTKMMERMEWMVEKATEIGFDRISFRGMAIQLRKEWSLSTDRTSSPEMPVGNETERPP